MSMPDHVLLTFTEAESLFASGDFSGAIARIEKALPELEGDILEADALNNKGYYLLHLGKWEEAIACFEKAYLIDPSFLAVLNHLAWAALMLDNREGAVALMDLFEKYDAAYQALHLRNKALLYTLEKEPENALNALCAAEEEDPFMPYMDMLKRANDGSTSLNEYSETDLQAVFLKQLLRL
ncbi:MAG: tetratricopeptide repeat protein [Bacteroidia bacterium]